MKRLFRPVAYSLIAVLAALAVFGEDSAAPVIAAPMRESRPARPASPGQASLPALRERSVAGLHAGLFAVDRAPPPPPPAPVVEVPPPPPPEPELKVLGWMQTETGPHVFVELENENHDLLPTQTAGTLYRFDAIGGGFAEFTYLPNGQSRRYPISDPTLLD